MSRKDTIVLAVLVNCALLIALFVTAIKKGDSKGVSARAPITEVSSISLPQSQKKEIELAQGDEIDRVLKEFSERAQKVPDQEKPRIDFSQELKALAVAGHEAPTPKQASPAHNAGREMTVRKGDALAKIAAQYGTTVSALMEANGLKTTNLRIGQVLKLPGKEKISSPQKVSSEPVGEFYTVKQGDNPWTIAVKNQLKVEELLKLNELDEASARKLKPGDRLRIRK